LLCLLAFYHPKPAKEFEVNVHYSDDKGTQVRIPKPILELMGKPDKITFVILGKRVEIKSS
jgi:hypothetical protein